MTLYPPEWLHLYKFTRNCTPSRITGFSTYLLGYQIVLPTTFMDIQTNTFWGGLAL